MTDSQLLALFLGASFMLGSIPFGWLIARLWGINDLRDVGSANVGATNVVRTAGWVPGVLTFALDFAKGVVPIVYFPGDAGIWYGLAAVLGHCYSPFLSFRGGKGVSTTLGALVAFDPWIGGGCILIYGIALGLGRISALGSLYAMLAALVGTLLFSTSGAGKLATIVMVFIVLARHRDNWDKILKTTAVLALLVAAPAPQARAYAQPALTDFRGKPAAAETRARRVAALMPALAELVADLGAAERLVAAPDYARLPPAAKFARLGAYNNLSAEAVYATHPDLVLASMDGNDAALVEKLESLGLRVVTINTQSLSDIVRSVEIVAAALGERGNPNVARFRKELGGEPPRPAPGASHPLRVFVQIGWEPLVTVGPATFIDELVHRAGGVGAFDDVSGPKYPRPNPEEVIARNPDVIVICRMTDRGDETDRAVAFWRQFTQLSAVKSGRIHVMPVDRLTKPGLNLLEGERDLKRFLAKGAS